MSLSLVAVFIPLLLMGGVVGRLFREFAVTLSAAVLVSMVVSLTATPAMCAHMLKRHKAHGRLYEASERAFNRVVEGYARTLAAVLRRPATALLVLFATIGLNVYLFIHVPKGFFPQQDNGRMMGQIQADQDTSFQAMDAHLRRIMQIVRADPAVDAVNGFTGGSMPDTARMFINLKPLGRRKLRSMLSSPGCGRNLPWSQASHALSAGLPRYTDRRTVQQRPLSIHDARRKFAGPEFLWAADVAGAAPHSHHRRREHRSAE